MTRRRVVCMALIAALAGAGLQAAPRPKAVGVVDFASRYTWSRGARAAQAGLRTMIANLTAVGLQPETVSPDLFLRPNWPERDRYRRLVVPVGAEYFSQAIHEGMEDYVRQGGLLITSVSMILQDKDADYVITDQDGIADFASEGVVGVHGQQTARMSRIKALAACPLTQGLAPGEWVTLSQAVAGRRTRNLSAEVVILSDRELASGATGEQPFLTYRHLDRGACIYLVGQIGTLDDPVLRQVFTNLVSPQTLDWLCLQE